MKTKISIGLFLLLINTISAQPSVIKHNHGNRIHAHPLPSSGLHHKHGKQQNEEDPAKAWEIYANSKRKKPNTPTFSPHNKKNDNIITIKQKLDAVKKTLLTKVGNEKYPYICTNTKKFSVGCVTYDHQSSLLFEVRYTENPKPSQLDNYDYDNKTFTSSLNGYRLQYDIYKKNDVIEYEKLEEGNIDHKKFVNIKKYGPSENQFSIIKRTEGRLTSLVKSIKRSNSWLITSDGECYESKNQNTILCISTLTDIKKDRNENESILIVKSYLDNPERDPGNVNFKYDSNTKTWFLRTINTNRMSIHKALSQATKGAKKISHIKKINFR